MVSRHNSSYFASAEPARAAQLQRTYPKINLKADLFSTSGTVSARKPIDSLRSVIVPVNEGVIKRIIRTYFESNFFEALNEARDAQTVAVRPWLAAIAEITHRTLTYFVKLRAAVLPRMEKQGISSIANYSETRDWIRSIIRAIAWHPNCFKIAVAGADDIVRIYNGDPAMEPVLLKSANQKWITAVAWRPNSPCEIAIGCEKGICFWTIDYNQITRSSTQETFLNDPDHYPVIALQWNPNGRLLASATIGSTNVLIWDVDRLQNNKLLRIGAACSLLKWSPNESYLFSTTVSNVFHVWCTDNKWIPERWIVPSGSIKSACWSPCSNYLLFITTADPLLYQMQFYGEQLFATDVTLSKQAIPIADLSKISIHDRIMGGQAQAIVWDPNGLYVAVSYQDTSYVVVFAVFARKQNLLLSPNCLIAAIDDEEYPSCICFQSKTRLNSETVLSIGWSSGRIQFYPFAKD